MNLKRTTRTETGLSVIRDGDFTSQKYRNCFFMYEIIT